MAIDSHLCGTADPVLDRFEKEARGWFETLLDHKKMSS